MDSDKVTEADRIAAASIAVLVEMRKLILAGCADHHAEPFARHRLASTEALREENERLREALSVIENTPAWGYPETWETTPAQVRILARKALDTEGAANEQAG